MDTSTFGILRSGTTLARRYQLDLKLAVGGMGEVWSATDRILDREVAVKLLRADVVGDGRALERFRAEARHAASLVHPGVARVYDYGEEDGDTNVAWLVMELIDGEPVSRLLARAGTLAPLAVVDLLIEAADALAAAHDKGIVHRDVKPGNMLIDADGKLKLTDFGIAHAIGSATFTDDGQVTGTARYMSPEQATGQTSTPSSDVYSLAVVGYELLAGHPPFDGPPAAVALAHVRQPPDALPPSVPDDLGGLLLRAMSKDPARRPPDGAAFAAELRQLRDSSGSTKVIATTAAAVTTPQTLVAATLAQPILAPGRPATPLVSADGLLADRHRRRAAGIVATVIALAVVALAIWSPGMQLHTPVLTTAATTTAATPAPASVNVDRAALVGRPLGDVQAQLQSAGLPVTVTPADRAGDATALVVDIQPNGAVPLGTSITVTVDTSPVTTTAITQPPENHGKGKGKDKGNTDNGD